MATCDLFRSLPYVRRRLAKRGLCRDESVCAPSPLPPTCYVSVHMSTRATRFKARSSNTACASDAAAARTAPEDPPNRNACASNATPFGGLPPTEVAGGSASDAGMSLPHAASSIAAVSRSVFGGGAAAAAYTRASRTRVTSAASGTPATEANASSNAFQRSTRSVAAAAAARWQCVACRRDRRPNTWCGGPPRHPVRASWREVVQGDGHSRMSRKLANAAAADAGRSAVGSVMCCMMRTARRGPSC